MLPLLARHRGTQLRILCLLGDRTRKAFIRFEPSFLGVSMDTDSSFGPRTLPAAPNALGVLLLLGVGILDERCAHTARSIWP